ncbi:MAG: alpha-ketoglutarate-dependent dioxygenase AlkB [Pseudomonadota bacterium]
MSNLGLFEGLEAGEGNQVSSAEAAPTVEGLSYAANFIDPDEEARLLTFIDDQEWRSDHKRRVQHYGYVYDYRTRRVTHADFLGVLPSLFDGLAERLQSEGLFERAPDQVIVNEYLPGQGIAPHIDCQPCFGDTIASLSLAARSVMAFTHSSSREKQSAVLGPRSLLVLRGAARHQWRHSIAARKSDLIDGVRHQRGRRISLTFRMVNI